MELNSNVPMELLANIPARLTKTSLETIQAVIDNDKLICSTMLGRDLCGEYAPFCALCDRSIKTPCAIAYIRLKQAEEIQLEIAASNDEFNKQSLTDFSHDGINVDEVEELSEENSEEAPPVEPIVVETEQSESAEAVSIEVAEIVEEQTVALESSKIDADEVFETVEEDQAQEDCAKNSRIRIAVAKRKK